MIVLFINAHQITHEGQIRFRSYYETISKLLKKIVYYGKDYKQMIRNKDQLEDFLYDPDNFQNNQQAKIKMSTVEYIFIDGEINCIPWSYPFYPVLLMIKNCIKNRKNIHCNGLAHFLTYYYLSTGFDKPYKIISNSKSTLLSPQKAGKIDYIYEKQSGNLYFHGNKVCNSGIRIAKQSCRPFSYKSTQALKNGLVLQSKFHYVAFNSKNGQNILKNIQFPFKFFCKGRIFCSKKNISHTKADFIVQTENKEPLAYAYKFNLLSTQGLCPEFIQMIQNWLLTLNGKICSQITDKFNEFNDITVENKTYQSFKKLNMMKNNFVYKAKTLNSRPPSSKFSTQIFDRPSLRCSGVYQTEQNRYKKIQKDNKNKNISKNWMKFGGTLSELQIQNYVNRTHSRPVSSYKYRQIDKKKWVCTNTFLT